MRTRRNKRHDPCSCAFPTAQSAALGAALAGNCLAGPFRILHLPKNKCANAARPREQLKARAMAETTENQAAEAPAAKSPMVTVAKIAAFVVVILTVEALIAFLLIPSAGDVTAMAEARYG